MSVCPFSSVLFSSPIEVSKFQSRIVESDEAEASFIPEQFQSTEYTRFLCPVYSLRLNFPKFISSRESSFYICFFYSQFQLKF